ncbi:uncharacterized protein [Periplaneta americana]|uniref:uncharacterized protein n=1 Tax=Periplaneta americana TaxID=6978 RepID=UPI0037E98083
MLNNERKGEIEIPFIQHKKKTNSNMHLVTLGMSYRFISVSGSINSHGRRTLLHASMFLQCYGQIRPECMDLGCCSKAGSEVFHCQILRCTCVGARRAQKLYFLRNRLAIS